MRKLLIFGKKYTVIEKKSTRNSVRLGCNKIIVYSNDKAETTSILKDFLASLLHSELHKIYAKIGRGGKIEVFGNLDFEVKEKIDNKKQRIAKLKGNRILVKLDAVALPKSALRYVIVHEVAHIFAKRHTERFWRTVKTIYPEYEKGQKLLYEGPF